MKNSIIEFFRRGLISCGLGPLVLAVIYLILQRKAGIDTLTVNQVCTGIFSLSALAFIAGGMNILYQIERLPLMLTILIHGAVLYIGYLSTYLINGWMQLGTTPVLVFSLIFIIGYLVIWAAIYFITKKNTEQLNEILKKKHNSGMN